jgi:hypothetical protein
MHLPAPLWPWALLHKCSGRVGVRKTRTAWKENKLIAMYEPTVYKMWEPRRLTALWACTARYRDNFTFALRMRREQTRSKGIRTGRVVEGSGRILICIPTFTGLAEKKNEYSQSRQWLTRSRWKRYRLRQLRRWLRLIRRQLVRMHTYPIGETVKYP